MSKLTFYRKRNQKLNRRRIGLYLPMTLFISSLSVLLTGCLNDQFDCPDPSGVSCMRLDQVNQMVNQSKIPGMQPSSEAPAAMNSAPPSSPIITALTAFQPALANQNAVEGDSSLPINVTPARVKEVVLPIWLAPYEDAMGNYHTASMIYSVMMPAEWLTPSLTG